MKETLSNKQAVKIVLLSQRVPPLQQRGSAVAATLAAVEHLGYVQIDTISVVARAHHHTLWNRNPRYNPSHIDQLFAEKKIFEYWSHAAAWLPMRDYRFSLPRKQALVRGEQMHWFQRDESLMKYVMERITAEGPLMAKDFIQNAEKSGGWGSKPAKQALENLFMQGELMVPCRKNFHKVYDLTERVLPEGLDSSIPSREEYARFLIRRYLQANGLGQAAEISYLRKDIKPYIVSVLQEMHSGGEVLEVKVDTHNYYALPSSLNLARKPYSRSKLKILSPFDNLLIQRKRIKRLFDFNYQLECYLPEKKRRYGYFSLPILWQGTFVARMDCKAERKKAVLHIYQLALEPGLTSYEAFAVALKKELRLFMKFNCCSEVQLHRTTPESAKSVMQEFIK